MTEQVVYVPMEGITTCLSVSASTVRNCMKDGRIPSDLYFKVGKNYRFNLAAIIALFQSQMPVVEIAPAKPEVVEVKQEVIETVQKVSENPLQEPAPVQLQFDFDADLDI